MCVHLKPKLLQKTYIEFDTNFRVYSRPILTLATTLHRSRDMKNLFVEIAQIMDFFKQSNWSQQDLEMFLEAYTTCALEIDTLRTDAGLKQTWEKFMKVISCCLIIMYT